MVVKQETRRTSFEDFLTKEQKRDHKISGFIEVTGSLGGIYRIPTWDYGGSVAQVNRNGVLQRSWCCHLDSRARGVDWYGNNVAQVNALSLMLLIKTNEKEFQWTAH